MKNCCKIKNYKSKKCIRIDKKVFNLPRKFSIKKCKKKIKGFTMRSSCAPFKYCKKIGGSKKKQFLFNPNNPKKSFDVYIDKNPKDTISIKYKTLDDIKKTIKKLEKLYKTKKYSHKRIWQVGMIMKVRLRAIKKHKTKKAQNINRRYNLSNRYFKFLGKRTNKKTFKERKNMKFNCI